MTEPIWPNKKDISIHKQYPTRRELYEQGFDYGFNESIDACKLAWEQSPKPRPVVTVEEIESTIYQSLKGIMKSKSTGQEWNLWLHKDEVNTIAQAIVKHLQGE